MLLVVKLVDSAEVPFDTELVVAFVDVEVAVLLSVDVTFEESVLLCTVVLFVVSTCALTQTPTKHNITVKKNKTLPLRVSIVLLRISHRI